jgi:prevent-host-death family protein
VKEIGIFEIKTKLSSICEEVARTGESVLVTKRGKPFVRIDPIYPDFEHTSPVWEAREQFEKEYLPYHDF